MRELHRDPNLTVGLGRGPIISSSGEWPTGGTPAEVRQSDPYMLKPKQTVEVRVKGGKTPLVLDLIMDGRVMFINRHGKKTGDAGPAMRELFDTLVHLAEG